MSRDDLFEDLKNQSFDSCEKGSNTCLLLDCFSIIIITIYFILTKNYLSNKTLF